MIPLTSIPFYLWKNTLRRWLEHLFSPLGKILIPALLALLGIGVLSLFGQIERELKHQLKKTSALSVHVSEYVSMEHAPSMIQRTEMDELMWSERYGDHQLRHATQMLVSAGFSGGSRTVPVFAVPSPPGGEGWVGDMPVVRLLSSRQSNKRSEVITLAGKKLPVLVDRMPEWLRQLADIEDVVLIPDAMAGPLKQRGYVHHMIASLSTIDQVEQFTAEVSAYAKADNRQVKVASALSILRDLERISKIQRTVRTMIVLGCGVILAFTLGSIAWMEYRQDAYLLALLRSFGTPVPILFIHTLLENLLLVMLGIASSILGWKMLCGWCLGQLKGIGFEVSGIPELPLGDVLLIVIAGLAGVLLAMVPVAVGLRKPPGMILQ